MHIFGGHLGLPDAGHVGEGDPRVGLAVFVLPRAPRGPRHPHPRVHLRNATAATLLMSTSL
eukprot:1180358-Prorocentrum_minimum.AAC.3